MSEGTKTIVDIGIGPLFNGTPGVTLVVSLSDGSSAVALLGVEQARDLIKQITLTINPPFPSADGLQLVQR